MEENFVKAISKVKTKSFRDPGGKLLVLENHVIRTINQACAEDFRAFLNSKLKKKFSSQKQLVHTNLIEKNILDNLLTNEEKKILLQADDIVMVVEHNKIDFQSFPYEWSPEMLVAAGNLTLDLSEKALEENMGLKDASPYNLLFSGREPIFVDILSFEKRDPRNHIWLPYAQFIRNFYLPLLANKYFNVTLQEIFISNRDGLEPEMVYKFASLRQKLSPKFLTTVTIPSWFKDVHNKDTSNLYEKKLLDNSDKAKFILKSIYQHLHHKLKTVTPKADKESTWSDYMNFQSYSSEAFREKSEFIKKTMQEFSPKKVLDIGCNTGYYSVIASQHGAEVVATDYDPTVIDQVWKIAVAENLNILPLVVDLTRPTPAIGWYNSECPSFLERAKGKFDAVFMLAVIHHMIVSERIPLDEIIKLAADLTTDLLVIEFVKPSDPMFRKLARGRDNLYIYLTKEFFEKKIQTRFNIIRWQNLSENRILYLMRRK